MVMEDFTKEVTSGQTCRRRNAVKAEWVRGRAFQAEGTEGARAQRWECAQHVGARWLLDGDGTAAKTGSEKKCGTRSCHREDITFL